MIVGIPTTSYPRDANDVSGDFVRSMALALVRRGHRVEVLAPEPREQIPPLRDEGIDVFHVPYLRPRSLERLFYGAGVPDNLRLDPMARFGLLTYPPMLVGAIRSRIAHWDAAISNWGLPSAVAVGLAGKKLPHVAVMHSADVHLLSALPARRILAEAIERSATSLWFTAPYLAARFATCLGRAPNRPVDIAPMGFDEAPSTNEPRETVRARLGISGFVVLTMGRLVAIKGIDRVIDACRALDVELIVAGAGPEERALRERAAGARVRFVGTIRANEKRDWLRAADVFVLGSRAMPDERAEGAPVSLLEAMDASLPVVATDAGGVAATVGDAALLVGDNTQSIADGIATLRDSDRLRSTCAERGRERSRPHHWDERILSFESRLHEAPKAP